MSFNGSTSKIMINSPSYDFSNKTAVSMDVWCKPTNLTNTNLIQWIRNTPINLVYFQQLNSDLNVWVHIAWTLRVVSCVWVLTTDWQHLTMTFDWSNIYVYRNWVQIWTWAYTWNITTWTWYYWTIWTNNGGNLFFNWLITNSKIYNRSLSETEIQQDYYSNYLS